MRARARVCVDAIAATAHQCVEQSRNNAHLMHAASARLCSACPRSLSLSHTHHQAGDHHQLLALRQKMTVQLHQLGIYQRELEFMHQYNMEPPPHVDLYIVEEPFPVTHRVVNRRCVVT
jgi:hypothetical protein